MFRGTQQNFGNSREWTISNVSSPSDGRTAHGPGVSLQGNTLNVLWADNQEPAWKVRGSQASAAISGPDAFLPDVVAQSAHTVYAVYSRVNPDTGDYDIFWNRSDTGGVDWPNETLLLPTPNAPSLYPSVTYAAQQQQVWVVWREWNGTDWTIRGELVQ